MPIVVKVTVSTEPRAANDRPDQARPSGTEEGRHPPGAGRSSSRPRHRTRLSGRHDQRHHRGRRRLPPDVLQLLLQQGRMRRRRDPGLVRRHHGLDPADAGRLPLDDLLFGALTQVAALRARSLGEVRLAVQRRAGPAVDAGRCRRRACRATGRGRCRSGRLPADDIRVRMLSSFGITAGRLCLEDWVLHGRPGGERSFRAQLELAFSIINLPALRPSGARIREPTCQRSALGDSTLRRHAAQPVPADRMTLDTSPLSTRPAVAAHQLTRPARLPHPPCPPLTAHPGDPHGHPALPTRTLRDPSQVGRADRLAGPADRASVPRQPRSPGR